MRKGNKYCFLLVAIATWSCSVWSQQAGLETKVEPGPGHTDLSATAPANSIFTIRQIFITGNKKTRDDIILREIPFKTGDQFQLKDLVNRFEEARKQLLNTALFHEVVVALKTFDGYNVDVAVDVRERWYLFPIPYFKPVDRNLNQWLVEQHASLSRVNYGLKILHTNATGRNDKFRLWLIGGYTKQISVSYDRLYIDKQMRWGMRIDFSVGKNREVNYNTINDKQVFVKDNDNYIRTFMNTNLEITYRKAIKTRLYFGVGYTLEDVSDTIVALNPEYFKHGRNRIQFPEFYFRMTYFDLDYIPYPTKGFAAEFYFGKKGVTKATNLWQTWLKTSNSWHIGKKSFVNLTSFASIKWPFKQPYFNLRFLGYNDSYMQGYEYFVIDGVAGGYLKASLVREIFSFKIKTPPRKGLPANGIPVRIFAKVYGNSGYVYNPQPGDNSLTNELLNSAGVGIDILTLYDFTLKFEWTFNQLGQNGLFLHRRSIF